jgi:hypothetical protein
MSLDRDPRYPIGKFAPPAKISREDRRQSILTIEQLPELLRKAVHGLDAAQLATSYRDGGWTVLQVVHHLADSHMTAFHRVRRALTEDWPIVAGYDEKAFANLTDSQQAPVASSLDILEGLHARWGMLLQSLTDDQWQLGYKHIERGPTTIDAATPLYAWHCQHHLAHITELRTQKGW